MTIAVSWCAIDLPFLPFCLTLISFVAAQISAAPDNVLDQAHDRTTWHGTGIDAPNMGCFLAPILSA
jgi:hypothetical protein